MFNLKIKLISNIVNGKLICKYKDININIKNLSINSEIIKKKTIFVAFKGKKKDGHDFIENSINNGAIAILVNNLYKNNNIYIPQILVNNTYDALKKISCWIRNKKKQFLVAITGTCGKTTIKEIVSFILKKNNYKVIYTEKNNNNNIGVILTLMNININTKYIILEIGANTKYEILNSVLISKPNLILINNLYIAHIEFFKNIYNLSESKSEIFYGLKNNSKIILNYDNNNWEKWKFLNINKNIFPMYFSIHNIKNNTEFYIENLRIINKRYIFDVITPIGKQRILLNKNILLYNMSILYNIVASIAILINIGLNLKEISSKIRLFKGIEGRLYPYFYNNRNIILVDDSYNANIGSIYNSLNVINNYNKYIKILIIGDIKELGDNEIIYHKKIGFDIKTKYNINYIFSLGILSKYISIYNNNSNFFYNTKDLYISLISFLNKINIKNKKIFFLIKGSRSNNLENIVVKLIYYIKKNVL